MKNVLITGGVGFIGTNLAEELVKQNYNVMSLDNYSFGSKENEIEGVKYFNSDIEDIDKIVNIRCKSKKNFAMTSKLLTNPTIGFCIALYQLNPNPLCPTNILKASAILEVSIRRPLTVNIVPVVFLFPYTSVFIFGALKVANTPDVIIPHPHFTLFPASKIGS